MSLDEEADSTAENQSSMPDNSPPAIPWRAPGTRGSRRRLLASAAVALTAVAGGIGVARAAAADDGPASPETAEQAAWWEQEEDHWRRQESLTELKTWIDSQPAIETSGYIESVNNPETGSTVLLWHGPANRMQEQIKQRAHQMGIPVTVEQRRYGRTDIDRAHKMLLGCSGKGAFINFKIIAVGGVTADFDGIIVNGEYIHPVSGTRAEADAALAKAATAEIGVAVTIEPGGNLIPA